MRIRHLAFLLLAVLLASCGDNGGGATAPAVESQTSNPPDDVVVLESEQDLIARARGIHQRVITLDTHADINTENFTATNNYTMDLETQVTLPKMQAGGLDVAWFIVYTGQGPLDEAGYAAAYANADDKFNAIHRLAEEIAPEQIEIALTSDDVRRIDAAGKKIAMIGIENAYPMGQDIARVKEFYERGGRYMSLSHNGHNQLADSNTGERDNVWLHNGLSELGRQAVAEMNKWGIMIDLSHPSKEANVQALALTRAPVIASHSSPRAMNDVPRNIDDEVLMLIKENGGVVQTVAFRAYLNTAKNDANAAARSTLNNAIASQLDFSILAPPERAALSENDRAAYDVRMAEVNTLAAPRLAAEVDAVAPPVSVSDFVDHIDYMVNLIGLEHVGISSDFDGGGGIAGWNDAAETFNVTLELVRRGYSEEDIAALWSGNLLRVLDQVQAVAAQIQAAGN